MWHTQLSQGFKLSTMKLADHSDRSGQGSLHLHIAHGRSLASCGAFAKQLLKGSMNLFSPIKITKVHYVFFSTLLFVKADWWIKGQIISHRKFNNGLARMEKLRKWRKNKSGRWFNKLHFVSDIFGNLIYMAWLRCTYLYLNHGDINKWMQNFIWRFLRREITHPECSGLDKALSPLPAHSKNVKHSCPLETSQWLFLSK